IERGFLSQKGRGVGRGVKEKHDTMVVESVEDVPPIVEPVATEVQSPLMDKTNAVNTGGGSYPPLPTKGNEVDVVVPVKSIRAVSDRFANSAYGFFLGKQVAYPFSSMDDLNSILENGPWFIRSHPIILKKWNPDVNLLKEDVGNVPVWAKLHVSLSSYARVMIELRVDVELKDTIVLAMPKSNEEGFYTCNVECPKNPGLGAGATETKMKKSSQAPKGIPGNKKKGVDSTNKVSDSNPFEVLNLVDNDEEMGTNDGTSNLDKNGANSSGSSFWNVKNSSTSTTPIMDKIRKFVNLIIDGKAILVDEASNPLKKAVFPGDEVASVDNDMAHSLALERTGFGTQSLLEQWRDSYGNGDYDEEPYDDDMYKGQDLSEEMQTICDKLDIRVRGCKKQ
ncbi:ribonuclease H-like domain, reverse transcriptase, RNA-dependent DNA polymerase, partial [Tanacetum coccineum]